MLRVGDASVDAVRFGAAEADALYLGTNLLYKRVIPVSPSAMVALPRTTVFKGGGPTRDKTRAQVLQEERATNWHLLWGTASRPESWIEIDGAPWGVTGNVYIVALSVRNWEPIHIDNQVIITAVRTRARSALDSPRLKLLPAIEKENHAIRLWVANRAGDIVNNENGDPIELLLPGPRSSRALVFQDGPSRYSYSTTEDPRAFMYDVAAFDGSIVGKALHLQVGGLTQPPISTPPSNTVRLGLPGGATGFQFWWRFDGHDRLAFDGSIFADGRVALIHGFAVQDFTVRVDGKDVKSTQVRLGFTHTHSERFPDTSDPEVANLAPAIASSAKAIRLWSPGTTFDVTIPGPNSATGTRTKDATDPYVWNLTPEASGTIVTQFNALGEAEQANTRIRFGGN